MKNFELNFEGGIDPLNCQYPPTQVFLWIKHIEMINEYATYVNVERINNLSPQLQEQLQQVSSHELSVTGIKFLILLVS